MMAVPATSRYWARLVCAALSVVLTIYCPSINGYVPRGTQSRSLRMTPYSFFPPRRRSCCSTFDVLAAGPTGPLLAGATTTSDETSGAENTSTRRRRRRNKYADFSKVEALEMDPLERLVAESVQKNQVLEQHRQRQRSSTAVRKGGVGGRTSLINDDNAASTGAQTESMSFPDNKDIDPYDPTTFGYVPVGSILAAHGVHGWVKVQSVPSPTALSTTTSSSAAADSPLNPLARSGTTLHVKLPRKRAPRAVQLVSGRHCVNDEYLCLIEGVHTRDDATRLRGAVLYTRQEDRAQHQTSDGDESYFVSELIGLAVYAYDEARCFDSAGLDDFSNQPRVGSVGGVVFGDDISDLPLGYDMLEVIVVREAQGNGKPEERVLIPLVPQLVPVIDTARGFVLIDPPTGLLDLRYVREEKVRIKGLLPPSPS